MVNLASEQRPFFFVAKTIYAFLVWRKINFVSQEQMEIGNLFPVGCIKRLRTYP